MVTGPQPSPFPDHFSALAGDYCRYRPQYPPDLFAYLASLAPARQHAWDCATGNGQAALGLAPWFQRVTASEDEIVNAGSAERPVKAWTSSASPRRCTGSTWTPFTPRRAASSNPPASWPLGAMNS